MLKVINEYGSFRIRWDIFISILIVLSIIIIPFQLAFIHEVDLTGSILIYAIDLFFILAIVINRRTSYRFAGEEITDKRQINTRYKRKDFVFDLFAALPLEIIFILVPEVGFQEISLVLWFRLIRLIRIRQLFIIFKRWQRLYSINPGFLRIAKFFSVIMLLSHIIACGWYLSAFLSKFPEKSWAVLENIHISDVFTQYVRSIYWTITTMTSVGYGDIVPHLNYEYIFSIIAMLIGASTYAFIIGNIASLISSLDAQKSNYWNNLDSLKLYLKQRGVSRNVNSRVQNFYEYRWVHHRGINEDVLLNNLPEPFRLEVMQELTKELLEEVPMFKYCSRQLKNVLILALHAETFNPGSFISRTGDNGNEIVFISKGIIQVVNEPTGDIYCELESGEYFGNLSIVLQEKRTAAIRTKTFCETFILDSNTFYTIKKSFPEFMDVMKKMSAEKSGKTNQLLMDGIII
ncbi:ion transporter [Urechidicola vernalis]|uniref:Ion transporter n=1 Tax=Urechidicola vernalis TaxID=3075600 RepID=A0ABU2Y1L2_9FLAO|nr:ion transporter [Urechidicola sp. P050]MDT0552098.1 ion transporter [Urechidicola sp. P050]